MPAPQTTTSAADIALRTAGGGSLRESTRPDEDDPAVRAAGRELVRHLTARVDLDRLERAWLNAAIDVDAVVLQRHPVEPDLRRTPVGGRPAETRHRPAASGEAVFTPREALRRPHLHDRHTGFVRPQ